MNFQYIIRDTGVECSLMHDQKIKNSTHYLYGMMKNSKHILLVQMRIPTNYHKIELTSARALGNLNLKLTFKRFEILKYVFNF